MIAWPSSFIGVIYFSVDIATFLKKCFLLIQITKITILTATITANTTAKIIIRIVLLPLLPVFTSPGIVALLLLKFWPGLGIGF